MYVLKDLLISMSEQNASDLHLTLGSPPRIRINGKLNPIEGNKLSAKDITQMLQEYLSDDQLKTINMGTELDFTIGISTKLYSGTGEGIDHSKVRPSHGSESAFSPLRQDLVTL